MPFSKDNWENAFTTDANGDCALSALISTGAGTANLKGLDYALEQVIDPATGKMRILVV